VITNDKGRLSQEDFSVAVQTGAERVKENLQGTQTDVSDKAKSTGSTAESKVKQGASEANNTGSIEFGLGALVAAGAEVVDVGVGGGFAAVDPVVVAVCAPRLAGVGAVAAAARGENAGEEEASDVIDEEGQPEGEGQALKDGTSNKLNATSDMVKDALGKTKGTAAAAAESVKATGEHATHETKEAGQGILGRVKDAACRTAECLWARAHEAVELVKRAAAGNPSEAAVELHTGDETKQLNGDLLDGMAERMLSKNVTKEGYAVFYKSLTNDWEEHLAVQSVEELEDDFVVFSVTTLDVVCANTFVVSGTW
jgi:hypothetical protein